MESDSVKTNNKVNVRQRHWNTSSSCIKMQKNWTWIQNKKNYL